MSSKKSSICPTCSLPIELCVCKQVSQEESKIKVSTDKRKWGRLVTILTFDTTDVNIAEVAKKLKAKAACGGTFTNNTIELQGDHRFQIKGYLKALGFDDDKIVIQKQEQRTATR